MAKIVTIHQPNYLPWIGFFSKVKLADCLIIGDTYLLGGQSPLNRNKIRTPNGWVYLTIPVGHKAEGTRICDITLPADKSWQKIHWRILHDNYAKSAFFNQYKPFFEELYRKDFQYICQINEEIIRYLFKCFNIEVEIIRASDLAINPKLEKTDLMIALLKAAGADVYLSGPSGKNYLEAEKFAQNKIELKYSQFQHPVYPQRFPGFEPNMAAVDLLFNLGPRASETIKNSGSISH